MKERRKAGETTVLIVDEAQSLSLELLEEIRLLANIETDEEKLLLVILAGQPELAERLNDRTLRQLKQRVALRCELRPLTLHETAAYLAGRIKAAGGVGAQVFTREAVTKIFESAHGVPRVISVIADNALLSAFAQGRRPVTSQVVQEVCRDFDLDSAAAVAVEPLRLAADPTNVAPTPVVTHLLDLGPTAAVKTVDSATGEDRASGYCGLDRVVRVASLLLLRERVSAAMSRVDEAMRRAAELADTGTTSSEDVFRPADAVDDVREFAREPFPIEMPEKRAARASAPTHTGSFAPVMAEAPRPAPVLPEVPKAGSLFERIDGSLAEKIVVDSNMGSTSREQYRRLAAALHHAQAARGLKVVMIASAVAGEGKTLTASNLALTLSESYKRKVLLVDADLRRPTLHTVFRIDNSAGLSDGLAHDIERRLPVRQVSERLAVLPAGRPSSDPMAGLTSDRMRRLLDEARDMFDWIIIDTPPVALLPDANLLASMVDTAVLIVKAGSTPFEMVQRALEAIGRDRTVGVVFNRADPGESSPQYALLRQLLPLAGGFTRAGMIRLVLHRLTTRVMALVMLETMLIVSAVGVAAYARLGEAGWEVLVSDRGPFKMLLVAVVCQACLYYADLYNLRLVTDRRELFIRIVQALGSASFILATLYFWVPTLIIGRGVFMVAALLVIALVIGWRVVFEWLSRRVRPRERLLLVGTNAPAVALAREMFERRSELGVEIVGFVDPNPSRVGAAVINPGVIGTIEDIPSIVRARGVDRVVVSLADARGTLPMDKLLEMKLDGVSFAHLASVYEEYTGKIAVENLRPSWLIFSSGFKKSRLVGAAKRLLDVIVSVVGLVVALPVMAVVAAAIKLTSPGPVLYHQRRVGHHGRVFTVHKFRSMQPDAEVQTGPVWAAKTGDRRVIPIGAFLRRARLDELPQLWNVLRGDMSLVGPRPERPEFVAELTKQIPYYGQRHIVRPGVTGWAQVRYTYGASEEDALQKLQYDLFYIKNLSLALDVFIMLNTVKTVLLRRGA